MKTIYDIYKKVLLTALLVFFQFFVIITINAEDSMITMANTAEDDIVQFCFSYHPPTDETVVVLPVGYNYVLQTSDVWNDDFHGEKSYEEYFTIDNEELASYNGYNLSGLKEGETVLHYRCGTKKGDLAVKVVPNLDIETMNQEAELADGKIRYSVKLKNKSKNDFTIEGFNLGGSIGSTSFLSLPWAAQEVILRAGETRTVTFLSGMDIYQITADDIAAHAVLPPTLYVKYEDAYLLISLKDFSPYGVRSSISYYGGMSFEQYLKRNDDAEDDDNSGDISDNDSKENQGESRKIVIKSVKASAKKQIKVKWNKIAGASGYQVQYALDKKFVKKSSIKNYKGTTGTIKNLKGGTKYFIRIRYYKKIDGKRAYSKWSKIKSCRTK